MSGSRGGGGGGDRGPDPPGKSQKYRVLSNTGLDLLENHKATKPAFHDGPSMACHFASDPVMPPAFSGISILSPPYQLKKNIFIVELDPL